METKEIKNIDRIIFLQRFTEEIIKNLSKRHDVERNVRIEKLKQKFNLNQSQPNPEVHDAFKKILNHKILESPRYQKNKNDQKTNKENKQGQTNQGQIQRQAIRPQQIAPTKKQIYTPRVNPVQSNNPSQTTPTILQTIRPEYSQKPKGFTLGKLDILIKDPFIQLLECPGPGKNVLVKKYNKINITKVILSQNDINEIISTFSQDSKIPIVGGILKAAVGDLVISAVASEQAGSRFIISKINPMQ